MSRIVIIFLILSLSVFANEACLDVYHYQALDNSPMEQRLAKHLQANNGFFPLELKKFLNSEISSQFAQYREQIKLLERKGVDSPLASSFFLYTTSVEMMNKAIMSMEKSLTPTWLTGALQTANGRAKKLDTLAEDFRSCKGNFDKCAVDLQNAAENAGKNIQEIEFLVVSLKQLEMDLNELATKFQKQPELFPVRQSVLIDSLQLLGQEVQKIQLLIMNSETLLDLEGKNIISAMFKINYEAPVIQEKIQELIIKGAPKKINEPLALNKKNEPNQMTSAEIRNRELNLLNLIDGLSNSSITDNAKVEAIYNAIKDVRHNITAETAVSILEKTPPADYGFENEMHSELYQALPTKWTGFRRFDTLIAFKILKIAQPSEKMEVNRRTINMSQIPLRKDTADKKETYQAEMATAFSNLLVKFKQSK